MARSSVISVTHCRSESIFPFLPSSLAPKGCQTSSPLQPGRCCSIFFLSAFNSPVPATGPHVSPSTSPQMTPSSSLCHASLTSHNPSHFTFSYNLYYDAVCQHHLIILKSSSQTTVPFICCCKKVQELQPQKGQQCCSGLVITE